MDPNYDWNFDENGVPIGLIGAFGKRLPKEVRLDRMGQINEKVSAAVEEFIQDSKKATAKLNKALPSDEGERAYAKSFLYYQVHLHQEATGEQVTFVEPGKISDSWSGKDVMTAAELAVSEHRSLGAKYSAYDGGLREDDLNRAFIVNACENYVLQTLEKVKNRNALRVTPLDLWNHVKVELDYVPEGWFEMLIPILIEDGWVLFNNDLGETCMLPYGSNVPGYDPDLGVEHPAWARSHSIPWPQ